MSKISFSLRRIAKNWADKPDSAAIFTDAANEIESLTERIAKLERALRYIADEGDMYCFTPMTDIAINIARKALGEKVDK